MLCRYCGNRYSIFNLFSLSIQDSRTPKYIVKEIKEGNATCRLRKILSSASNGLSCWPARVNLLISGSMFINQNTVTNARTTHHTVRTAAMNKCYLPPLQDTYSPGMRGVGTMQTFLLQSKLIESWLHCSQFCSKFQTMHSATIFRTLGTV
jgi:hypothetical protein